MGRLSGRLKPGEKTPGFTGLARGGEDRPGVFFQHGEPMRDVGCVIGARPIGDAKIAAKKGSAELRDKLFHGVTLTTEPAREIAVEPSGMPGPVGQFVQQGCIVTLGRSDRFRAGESISIRHLDMIGSWPIVGTIATDTDVGGCRHDKPFRLDKHPRGIRHSWPGRLPALDLLGIEDVG